MDRIPNLHQLQLFFQVAKEGSFSRAASSLNISQPSISIQIRQLEECLGVQLFDRLGRGIALNSIGRLLFDDARQIFDLLAKIEKDLSLIKGMKMGSVTVGASKIPSASILSRAVRNFKESYPDVEIRFHVAQSEEVEEWVLKNEVDFAIIVGNPRSPKISAEFLLNEEMFLVLSPGHRLANKNQVSLEEIKQERLLLPGPGKLKFFIENILATSGVNIKEQIDLGDRDAVKAAVNAGFGISIMSRSTVERDFKSGYIVAKRIRGNRIKYPINIIFHKDKHFTNVALEFLQFVRKVPHPAKSLDQALPARLIRAAIDG